MPKSQGISFAFVGVIALGLFCCYIFVDDCKKRKELAATERKRAVEADKRALEREKDSAKLKLIEHECHISKAPGGKSEEMRSERGAKCDSQITCNKNKPREKTYNYEADASLDYQYSYGGYDEQRSDKIGGEPQTYESRENIELLLPRGDSLGSLLDALRTPDKKRQWLWHYGRSSMWPDMDQETGKQFLTMLKALTVAQMELLKRMEFEGLFAESMHPINRLTIVVKTCSFFESGLIGPLQHKVLERFRKVKNSDRFQSEMEPVMWDRAKLCEDKVVPFDGKNVLFLMITSDWKLLNGHKKIVQALHAAKKVNLYVALYASMLINSNMSKDERIYIIEAVASFNSNQVRVLFHIADECKQNNVRAYNCIHQINVCVAANKPVKVPGLAKSCLYDEKQLKRCGNFKCEGAWSNGFNLFCGIIDGKNVFPCNAFLAVNSADYLLGFIMGSECPSSTFLETLEYYRAEYITSGYFEANIERLKARKSDLFRLATETLQRKVVYAPFLDYVEDIPEVIVGEDYLALAGSAAFATCSTVYETACGVTQVVGGVVSALAEVHQSIKREYNHLDPQTQQTLVELAKGAINSPTARAVGASVSASTRQIPVVGIQVEKRGRKLINDTVKTNGLGGNDKKGRK
jgi:hypothetical protein